MLVEPRLSPNLHFHYVLQSFLYSIKFDFLFWYRIFLEKLFTFMVWTNYLSMLKLGGRSKSNPVLNRYV